MEAVLDVRLEASHRRIEPTAMESGTSVAELSGVVPTLAGALIGYPGDVHRFASLVRLAPPTSAWHPWSRHRAAGPSIG
jgi:transposase